MKTVFLFLFICSQMTATIYISVSGANVKKAKIAIGRVHAISESVDATLERNLHGQIIEDLQFSNLFEFAAESDFAKYDLSKDIYQIKYEDWTQVGVSFVLRTGYRVISGKLHLEAILYDVPGQKKIFANRYQYAAAQYQKIVHTLSEDILKELTGEKGLFSSRIVMVCNDAKRRSPSKDIYIVDADGRNFIKLTSDNTISSRPSWMADGKTITYTQHEWVVSGGHRKKGMVLKRHSLATGERKVISSREGMNSGAAWSSKNDRGVATLSFTGRPELYFIKANGGGEPEPLSRNIQWKRMSGDFQANMDSLLFEVEPYWSPDGNKIVFSSARSGHPMIYIVDVATKIATQLTFAGQYNSSPTWASRGDKILFAAQQTMTGNFDIYMIDPDGNNLSRITAGDKVGRRSNYENPSFAPTGRHFSFASNESGEYAVYVMTTDSTMKTRISPEGKICQTPVWGPAEN